MTERRKLTIWKFPLVITDLQTVRLRVGAQLLGVYLQHNTPCLWAILDPDAPERDVNIRCRGTGHVFDDHGGFPHHLGTVVMNAGTLVFHFFSAYDKGATLYMDEH